MNNKKGYIVSRYSDILFSYYFSDDCMCSSMVRDHFLVYLYSGEYILDEGKRRTVIKPGECVFLKRDNRVNMIKQPKNGEPFMAIFLTFKRNFLRGVYQKFERKELPLKAEKQKHSVIKLPQTPDIKGLFQSLVPYFDSTVEPSDDIMKLKLLEGVYSLLRIDDKFYATLFDFTEPWKIDILEFLNENYMYDFSLEDIASFTGRSLSTFKRDFKKISKLSPEKWLIQRRLEAAREKLQEDGRTVTDVYVEVGFKNLSHFSSAFKKQYGVAPSSYAQ
ncbi:AraC-like DNA-binding protein [Dysgonomonas hofstadii]|uniref:AraC-like DNA-binding protein n=1 Tax=Dysgonomonas hofstadii TaxID=637886 RepID=A0A840CII2_9BACT|nr:helix-turn-helix domain-containing protein [Dysgonomonas hofstadii]MBB4035847.1 AraC-like DNA-binding protein [Dysgonomonas hofstadii]